MNLRPLIAVPLLALVGLLGLASVVIGLPIYVLGGLLIAIVNRPRDLDDALFWAIDHLEQHAWYPLIGWGWR